ncbi:MAG: cell envelope integrity protein TolA [Sulfuritalea sp.]|nr:cell envelope integrity protein TolA [Sulfuritalea sp.]
MRMNISLIRLLASGVVSLFLFSTLSVHAEVKFLERNESLGFSDYGILIETGYGTNSGLSCREIELKEKMLERLYADINEVLRITNSEFFHSPYSAPVRRMYKSCSTKNSTYEMTLRQYPPGMEKHLVSAALTPLYVGDSRGTDRLTHKEFVRKHYKAPPGYEPDWEFSHSNLIDGVFRSETASIIFVSLNKTGLGKPQAAPSKTEPTRVSPPPAIRLTSIDRSAEALERKRLEAEGEAENARQRAADEAWRIEQENKQAEAQKAFEQKAVARCQSDQAAQYSCGCAALLKIKPAPRSSGAASTCSK